MLINSKNGKLYIGSSIDLHRRRKEHFLRLRRNRHDNIRLQNAYNKGYEFEFRIIEICEVNELFYREQFYINELNPFYNIAKVVGGTIGYTHTPESKQKMSEAKKQLYKNGFKVWNIGISPSEEVRNKISNTLKGKFVGEDHPFYGKNHTEEARLKCIAASIRRAGTHHTGRNGRIFQFDPVTLEVINVFSSARAAAESVSRKGNLKTAGGKIAEAIKSNKTAYNYKWDSEKNLAQVKVDELLETLSKRAISSQATDHSVEGPETT